MYLTGDPTLARHYAAMLIDERVRDAEAVRRSHRARDTSTVTQPVPLPRPTIRWRRPRHPRPAY